MVRWARQKLLDKGILDPAQRGVWEVTPEGREFAQAGFEAAAEAAEGSECSYPEEVREASLLVEGAVRRLRAKAYERNPEARRRCVAHYGAICWICKFDFGEAYGEALERFIHIHHLRSLSEVGAEYTVDPVRDLRPVCPNCHAVLHRRVPPHTIEEVRAFLGGRTVRAVSV